jgi:hypothetical protein
MIEFEYTEFIEKPWTESDIERAIWEIKIFCTKNGYTVPLIHSESKSDALKSILIVKIDYKTPIYVNILRHLRSIFPLIEGFDLSEGGHTDTSGFVIPKNFASFMVCI